MANGVDVRRMQLYFDNKQFEGGVAQSLKTLDALKKGLDLDKSAESLKELEKTAKSFKISNIADGVDKITSRFTIFGKVIDKIKDNVADFAVTTLKNLEKTTFGKLREMAKTTIGLGEAGTGFEKYATKTKAVQTIMNATGKSLKAVEAVLEDLMHYTDETSYDFSTMVQTIGKFTASGVKLETAEKAMEGIGNAAALAGVDIEKANNVMYALSKSLSKGYVQMQEWGSVNIAGMSTKGFKEELIKTAIAMGKIHKSGQAAGYVITGTGKKAKKVAIDFRSFESTLKEAWLTSDVLVATLDKYAKDPKAFEAAQKALTYKDAIQAIKDTVSTDWMRTSELLFGNLEESIDLWTRVCNAVIEFADAFNKPRNEILKSWHELGGYNAMVEAASNIWHTFTNIVFGVKDALSDFFPDDLDKKLVEVTKSFSEATKKVRDFFSPEEREKNVKHVVKDITAIQRLTDALFPKLKKGMKGDDVKLLQNQLIKAGYALKKFGADGVFGGETEKALKKLQKDLGVAETGVWDAATQKAAKARKMFQEVVGKTEYDLFKGYKIKEAGGGLKIIQGIVSTIASVIKVIGTYWSAIRKGGFIVGKKLAEAFGNFGPAIKFAKVAIDDFLKRFKKSGKDLQIVEKITNLFKPLTDRTTAVGNFFNKWKPKSFSDFFKALRSQALQNFWKNGDKRLFNVVKAFNKLKSFFGFVKSKASSLFSTLSSFISDKFWSLINWFTTGLPKVIINISDFAEGVYNAVKNSQTIQNIVEKIKTAWNSALPVIEKVKNYFKDLFSYDPKLTLAENLKQKWESIKAKVGEIIDKIKEKIANLFSYDPKLTFVENLKLKIDSVKKKFKELYDKSEFLKTLYDEYIKPAYEKIKEFLPLLSSATTSAFEADTSGVEGFVPKLQQKLEAFEPVTKWLSENLGPTIQSFIDAVTDAEARKKAFDDAVEWVKSFWEDLKNLWKTLTGASAEEAIGSGSMIGVAGVLNSAMSRISDTVTNGFDPESLITTMDELSSFAGDNGLGWVEEATKEVADASKNAEKGSEELLKTSGNLGIMDQLWERVKAIGEGLKKYDFSKLVKPAVIGMALLCAFSITRSITKFFKKAGAGIVDVTTAFSGGLKGAFGGLTGLFGKASDFIGDSTIKSVLETVTNSVKEYGNTMAEAKKAAPKDSVGTAFLKVAGAIALVAAAVAGLSFIPKEQLITGFEAFAGIISLLTGAMLLLNKVKNPDKIGLGMMMLTGSIGVLALSLWLMVQVITHTPFKDLVAAIGVISFMLIELAAIQAVITWVSKDSKTAIVKVDGILAMCAGVFVLVLAVGKMVKLIEKYGNQEVGVALSNIKSLLWSLGIIEIVLAYLTKGGKGFKISGVLSMCAGIYVLTLAVGRMVSLSEKYGNEKVTKALNVIKGILWQLAIIEFALALASKGSKGIKIKGVLAMCAGIYVLTLAITRVVKLLKKNPKKTELAIDVIQGLLWRLAAIEVGIALFDTSGNGVKIKGVLAMCAGVYVLTLAIEKVAKDYDKYKNYEKAAKTIETALLSFGAAFLAIAIGFKIFSSISLEGTLFAAVGIIAQFALVPALIGALFEGLDALTNGQGTKFIESGLKKWGHMLGSLVAAFIEPLLELKKKYSTEDPAEKPKSFVDGISGLADSFNAAMDHLKPFLDKCKDITREHKVGVKNLVAILLMLTGTNMMDAISAFVGDTLGAVSNAVRGKEQKESSGSGFVEFAEKLITFSEKIQEFSEKAPDIKVQGITDSVPAFNALADVATAVKDIQWEQFKTAILTALSGDYTVGTFVGDLVEMVPNLIKFANLCKDLSTPPIVTAAGCLTALGQAAKEIPVSGGWVQAIFGEVNLKEFGDGLYYLGKGLMFFYIQVKDIPADYSAEGAAKSLISLGKVSSYVPRVGGAFQKAFGTSDIKSFGNQLSTLGSGLKGFYDNTLGIPAGYSAEGAANSLKALGKVSSHIPRVGGTFQRVFGTKSIWAFGSQLTTLGSGLKGFYDNAKDIPSDYSAAGAAQALKDIANATDYIPDVGGFVQKLFGEKGIEEFGQGLTDLASGLMTFYTNTKDIKGSSETEGALSVLTALSGFERELMRHGGVADWFGDASLGGFANGVGSLGASIQYFYDTTKDLPEIEEGTGPYRILTFLDGFEKGLKDHGGVLQYFTGDASLKTFGEDVASLGTNIAAFYTSVQSVKPNHIELLGNALAAISTAVGGTLDSALVQDRLFSIQLILDNLGGETYDYSGVEAIGEKIRDTLGIGISKETGGNNSPISTLSKLVDSAAKIVTTAVKITNDNNSFVVLGKYMVKGLAVGLLRNSWQAEQAFASVVRSAYYAGRAAARVASPSKETQWLGEMMDMGMVVGLQNYSGKVAGASEDVTQTALDSAKLGLSALSETILNDADNVPTIRPVLDLSEIQNEAAGIGNLFPKQTVAFKSATIAGKIAARDQQIEQVKSGSSNVDLAASIATLNDRLDQLGETINGMQVVMDNGALVGQIGPGINRYLGKEYVRSRR